MGAPETDRILVLNAGSSSIKLAVFDDALTECITGMAEAIGGASAIRLGGTHEALPLPDHRTALGALIERLGACGYPLSSFRAAAHRVVHGGASLSGPVRITAKTRAEIASCTPLAPLHNPHHLAAIDSISALAPGLPQYASFDTAFHATNPEVATRYAIPSLPETKGIRRYGFHGLSYASLTRRLPEISGHPLPDRLLAFHLGNGASLCAIRGGRSVATTMGYSPLDGLTMGTRSGGIDANAVLKLVEDNGLARTKEILNQESGLLGLSGGKSDMRRLMQDPSPEAAFAVAHFCYWSLRHAGSLIAAMQGCDAVAFTGGIGENAAEVRARIIAGLDWLGATLDDAANTANAPTLHGPDSRIAVWIVPAEEEREIARNARAILQDNG
ncbi:acetate/propionate family kinase [Cognatishimia sp. F0-27]|uniref:acetate/propionate family kinase n=1 Tax=Cognatishimia sp. F0-27 TaxID=2816855 RepID=UPI001D0CD65F|nr:acetate/propionate family kinase [Cognatishimia sp. F0-27]MCC1491372.1 acetate/propionate family kinase [Cognatishimia sp. F0-27]